MWGGNWNFQAAENIDGRNAVIWKETNPYDSDMYYLWLSYHDENWAYTADGDPGWQGDPRYGDSPNSQFYKSVRDFNIDLNKVGRIGPPPNKDPLFTGEPVTLPDGIQNNSYTINSWDLLAGYTDP